MMLWTNCDQVSYTFGHSDRYSVTVGSLGSIIGHKLVANPGKGINRPDFAGSKASVIEKLDILNPRHTFP